MPDIEKYDMFSIDTSDAEIVEDSCITFQKNTDEYGLFSNMHNRYPLAVMGITVKSTEALFQACRYPNYSDIQRNIFNSPHAWVAKQYARTYINYTRKDWFDVNIPLMYWCLRIKAYTYWMQFYPMFVELKNHIIVEKSRKDDFWGCKYKKGILCGKNIMGKLWMIIRDEMLAYFHLYPIEKKLTFYTIYPPKIPSFIILNKEVTSFDLPINGEFYYKLKEESVFQN